MGLTLCHPLTGQRAVALQELEGAQLLSLTGLADPWPRALLEAPPAAGPGETHLSSNRSPSTRKAQSCPSRSWISRPEFPPEWPWLVPLEAPGEGGGGLRPKIQAAFSAASGEREGWPEAWLLIFGHPPHPAKSPVWTGEREQQPLPSPSGSPTPASPPHPTSSFPSKLESVPGRRSLASQLHSARPDGSVPRKFRQSFPSFPAEGHGMAEPAFGRETTGGVMRARPKKREPAGGQRRRARAKLTWEERALRAGFLASHQVQPRLLPVGAPHSVCFSL